MPLGQCRLRETPHWGMSPGGAGAQPQVWRDEEGEGAWAGVWKMEEGAEAKGKRDQLPPSCPTSPACHWQLYGSGMGAEAWLLLALKRIPTLQQRLFLQPPSYLAGHSEQGQPVSGGLPSASSCP